MTGWDRETLALRLQAERRALLEARDAPAPGGPLSEAEWDTLDRCLSELAALPCENIVAERHEHTARWAHVPINELVNRALHQLAAEERAARPPEPEQAAIKPQPVADRPAVGQQGAALPTEEPPASDPGVSIPDDPNSGAGARIPEPPRPTLYMPHPQAWPSHSGGLWMGGTGRPTTVDGTPLEPRPRPPEREP